MRTLSLVIALALSGCCMRASQAEPTTVEAPPPAPEPAPVETAAAPEEDPDDVRIESDRLVLDGKILFASDSDEILGDSYTLLDHVALLINHHTDEISHLNIVGHTDTSGDAGHNQDLSERRAAAVVSYLRNKGVTVELDHAGAGETQPVCEEQTPECNARNRRVEFLIVPE